MIIHSVIFSLKHARGSRDEKHFLDDAQRILSAIPGVENFQRLRQVSRKNDHDFGFSMEFADHPDHVAFVRDRWVPEVSKFLEIDYESYSG
jgi:hypothetical protein